MSVTLVSLFAFCHGYAHGLELPEAAAAASYAAGFLMATAMLLGMGLALSVALRGAPLLARASGSLIALMGLLLLTAT